MKKMIMMAVAALVAVSAGAQNKDFQKLIKAAGAYQEALGVLNSNLSGLSAEDKALGYNKLVDLALDKFNKENNIQLTNQVTQKNDPFDKAGMIEAGINALKAAMECDKFDQMPNAKGKVAPKFHKKNAERVIVARNALLSAGQDLYNDKNYQAAQDAFGLFVDSRKNSLFSETDFSKEDFYTQIAYFAALAAYNNHDFAAASKYADYCKDDANYANDAMDVKVLSMKAQLKTKEDSVKYMNDLKALHAQEPANERFFSLLTEYYQATQDNAAKKALIDEQVAKYPSKMAWALKGESEMNDSKWKEAITAYKKALEADPEFLQVRFNLALCENQQAIALRDANGGNLTPDVKEYLQNSIDNLLILKEKDPNRETVNWAYTLYQAYYLMGDEAKAKELESLVQ